MKSSLVKGAILAVTAAILWGISGTFGQFLFQERDINVEWLITMRLLVSGILLLGIASVGRNKDLLAVWKNRNDTIQLFIFSITGMLTVQYTYFAAIRHSNAATATVLQYIGPILIAVYLAIKYRKLPNPRESLAILLAVVGTFLLVTHGHFGNLIISRLALFLGLASAVALAIYTLQPIQLLKKYSPTVVIGWAMLCGGLVFCLVRPPWAVSGIWDAQTYLFTLLIIVFGTLIPFTMYLNAVRLIGGQKASLLASAEPLAATLLAVYWLDTNFLLPDWIGSICIVSTVFLLTRERNPDGQQNPRWLLRNLRVIFQKRMQRSTPRSYKNL